MAREGALFLADNLPEIPNSWQWGRLGDLVDQSRGICYGIVQPGDHDTNGVPMVNSQNVLDGSVSPHIEFRVSKELHARYKRSTIRGGEILLTLVGANFGRVAIAPPAFAGFNCARPVGIIPVCEHPQFVMFCLRSPLTRQFMDNWANTTAQPTLNLKEVANLPIPLPPLAEQKAIAAVLGALDEKIELNRRMNATLEAMARALFQSWFVDFDPVRANLDDTRGAGVDEATAKLFPAHLEDSPLGKAPVGWRALKFADVLTPYSVRVGEESVPEFSATVTGLSSRDERFKKQLSKSQSKNKRIVEGDLVFGFSREVINFGLMREPVGAVSPVYEVFKIDSSKIEPELLERLFRFNMPFYMDILKPGAREGKPIDRDYLLRKHLLVPDIAVQRAFLATIQPWTDKIKANETESRTLATLRDTLLPKLLSGEVQIPNESQAS